LVHGNHDDGEHGNRQHNQPIDLIRYGLADERGDERGENGNEEIPNEILGGQIVEAGYAIRTTLRDVLFSCATWASRPPIQLELLF
jgi:hypothetical protein